ncbi:hypothetical protein LSM04_003097 [Trypanosoma melophagium]|uniref:uncharacterized protein n=1 Tax=Trypanosoma melophagium TaxID=715481 RepID=UPI00351A9192|nr:hypothetical protein LSM04_003097 [Trypanosoma melophagium]
MLFAANNVNSGAYVMYVGGSGQQQYLPLYLNAPSAIQTGTTSQALPVLFTQSHSASNIQHQQQQQQTQIPPPPPPPPPFHTNMPQAVLFSPTNTFFPFTADVGVPFARPYTQYMVPLGQAHQPVRDTSVDQTLRDSHHSVSLYSMDTGSIKTAENQRSNLDDDSLCNVFVGQGQKVGKKGGRTADISGVRNFFCPLGSVLERGRSTRMNVPPLARRRPPRCRIPQHLLDAAARTEVV